MNDRLRYVALRPFRYEGAPFAPGDPLPSPINPFTLRHLQRTGMVKMVLPDEVALTPEARPRRLAKEQEHVHAT